ncbi:MOSC domain-containing protein [Pseudalkalibacillus hwajinpoensis]|uniref:MOSC domain-containing protein n=1 Tax=Guptibacillus hwajinpoensis TaxID=208199 RepID=UPI00192646D5|nr:MOSC N-terminal beta barrel domain-containing protein [Pseudalkalibacillus hwajinpoensis]
MTIQIGTLSEIMRHPVKSMTGEAVTETMVMNYGLYGDRSHVILDEKESFLTITQFPSLVRYQASFSAHESLDGYPEPVIVTPEGEAFKWSDSTWLTELEAKTSKQLTKKVYHPEHVPIGPIEEEHLLILTDASLQALEESWGKQTDQRRFRPNLKLNLFEKRPFVEQAWEGKYLRIGEDVLIQFVKPCERCMIITVDPKTGEKQPELLKKIAQEHENFFGMYARVIQAGNISTNDKVWLLDKVEKK